MPLDADIKEKFEHASKLPFDEQAKWFLNGFWEECGQDAEEFWKVIQTFKKLDREAHPECTDDDPYSVSLDEFWSHKLLEVHGEPLTVIKFRETMRKIDLDSDKKMSPNEYFAYKYEKSARDVATAPQGIPDPSILEEAQAKVNQAQAAVNDVNRRLEEQKAATAAQKTAEAEAKRTEADAVAAEEAAFAAEAPFKAAEEENKAALAEVEKQQTEYDATLARLRKASEEGGIVSRNRAKNELEQALAEDPLPLNRAKITLAAASKKAEKLRAPFKEAREKAEQARAVAEQDRLKAEEAVAAAEEAQRHVEAAVAEAEAQMEAALANLEEVKQMGGVPQGAIWWMEREVEEMKKYMPSNRRTVKAPAGVQG